MVLVERSFTLLFLIFISAAIFLGIRRGKRGGSVETRPIQGLLALEEAVGRATELGRPIHYSTGRGELTTTGAPESLASIEILSYVSELCARYNAELIVTNRDPVLHSVTEGVVRQAFVKHGVPENYKSENIRYVSPQQFAAATQAMGIMEREKVSTNLMFGLFAAEALLLAEAAAGVGAMQVAATTNVFQIPFFVACCDYTLLGDEMFAGGAYCSQDKAKLGAVLGQDVVKLACIALIVVGVVMRTLGNDWVYQMLNKYGK